MNTTEAHARIRIDQMIASAGFILINPDKNDPSVSYERAIRNRDMNRRLKKAGKVPDYHFYPPNSATPIAFLEAKRQGSKLDAALGQATEYAKIACDSVNPPMIVFASDGYQVRSQHADGRELLLNNYPIDYIPSPSLMHELVSTPSAIQGEVISSVQALIKLYKDVANLMRADGIDAGINRLREFCSLLFIKIMSERGHQYEREKWDILLEATGQNLISEYKDIHHDYQQKYGDIFSTSELNNPEILEQIISNLTIINFTNSEIDVKGEAFEYFLSSYSAGEKSELGQYFTPRHITAMMTTLLSPQPGNKILDPFCGTGGMLISIYSHIRMGLDSSEKYFNSKLSELKKRTLYGNDISSGVSSLAQMNMIILGDGHSNIRREDSFESLEHHKYDKVITNIPFNLKAPSNYEKMSPFIKASKIRSPDANEFCIIKCLESLKPGGSAAIVLPITICNAPKYIQIRDYIARKCQIRACIRLPEETFIFYTSAQTVIIIVDKAHVAETDQFTYIHLKSDGMSQDKNREPIPENDILDLLEFAAENRIHETPGAVEMKYETGGSFLEFKHIFGAENVWRLEELLTIKNTKSPLESNKLYAQPGLDSEFNLVKVKGNKRLGRNIKSNKVIAERGDLIIGTLHTNNGNGLFAIADQDYICTSQIVASIREDLVPTQYLIQALRREFPRQLIPTDLVKRETFTPNQILNVLIPKPNPTELNSMFETQDKIVEVLSDLEQNKCTIETLLDNISE